MHYAYASGSLTASNSFNIRHSHQPFGQAEARLADLTLCQVVQNQNSGLVMIGPDECLNTPCLGPPDFKRLSFTGDR